MILAAAIVVAVSFAAGCGDDGSSLRNTPPSALGDLVCDITFGVTDEAIFRIVDIVVDYSRAPGVFAATSDRIVDCRRLVEGSLTQSVLWCADDMCEPDTAGAMLLSVNTNTATHGPVDLAVCRFTTDREPASRDFSLTVRDAAGPGLSSIPTPAVAVTDVRCSPRGATTSTTTTTLGCGDSACPEGRRCARAECLPETTYEIDFRILDDVRFGALQVEVRYECANGSVLGERSATRCRLNPDLNLSVSFNDRAPDDGLCRGTGPETGRGWFGAGSFGSSQGERAPTVWFTCDFVSHFGAPVPEDFEIEIVDATALDLNPLVPAPTVVVSDVRPVFP